MKRKKEDYSKKLIILEGKCARLEENIASIENTIQIQQQEQGEELIEKETKISDLKSQLDNLKSSQRKLISDKIGLDLEITAYMKMMELEEESINGSG